MEEGRQLRIWGEGCEFENHLLFTALEIHKS